MGRRNDAFRTLEQINDLSKIQYVSPYDFALVYAALGDQEQAFAWLEKARSDQSEWMSWLNMDHRFDGLRSDQRFTELLSRIGVP